MAALYRMAQGARRYQVALAIIRAALVDVIDLECVAQATPTVRAHGQLPHAHQILGTAGQAARHDAVCH